MEGFTKIFQENTALNLEHRNILISILAEDLLNIKKQGSGKRGRIWGRLGWWERVGEKAENCT